MRTLAVTQNITLDGSIEMLDDWFDPEAAGSDNNDDHLAELHRQDTESDALLLGRQTFEDFRAYWPNQTDDATGITAYLNDVPKYVVSSTLTDPNWSNSTVLQNDPIKCVGELKHRAGKDIVVTGSITVTHELISAGLVDEFRLFVYPAVQGRGRKLFPAGAANNLRLLDRPMAFRSGIVFLRYALT